jgi:hypothetical protein
MKKPYPRPRSGAFSWAALRVVGLSLIRAIGEAFINDFYVWQRLGIKALEQAAEKQPAKFIMVARSLIPQHFKFEHEHKLSGLSDAELQRRLIEAEREFAAAGVTIDLEANEVVALPSPHHERDTEGTLHIP